jgi:hypothetical protein
MHHPEQPPLPGVRDVGLRRKHAVDRRAGVSRLANQRVDIVDQAVVVDEHVDRLIDRHLAEQRELVRPSPEPGSPQQMLDLAIRSFRHDPTISWHKY